MKVLQYPRDVSWLLRPLLRDKFKATEQRNDQYDNNKQTFTFYLEVEEKVLQDKSLFQQAIYKQEKFSDNSIHNSTVILTRYLPVNEIPFTNQNFCENNFPDRTSVVTTSTIKLLLIVDSSSIFSDRTIIRCENAEFLELLNEHLLQRENGNLSQEERNWQEIIGQDFNNETDKE